MGLELSHVSAPECRGVYGLATSRISEVDTSHFITGGIRPTAREYLLASANALTCRHTVSSGVLVDAALAAYISEVGSIEAEGLMADHSVEERARVFALGFALTATAASFLGSCTLSTGLGTKSRSTRPDPPTQQSGSNDVALNAALIEEALRAWGRQPRMQSSALLSIHPEPSPRRTLLPSGASCDYGQAAFILR